MQLATGDRRSINSVKISIDTYNSMVLQPSCIRTWRTNYLYDGNTNMTTTGEEGIEIILHRNGTIVYTNFRVESSRFFYLFKVGVVRDCC